MDVCLIQVPSHAGDDRHPAGRGPQRLIEAGAVEVFTSRDLAVSVECADRQTAFRDTATASAEVNRRLAGRVGTAVAAGQLPVVLAGSCNACLGVLAGFEHERCGAVWIDAHADFNTPDSTRSGFLPGMSAAVITGHCYRDYWAQIGDNTPLGEDAVVMLGVRDLSPEAEQERLRSSSIEVVEWRDGRPATNCLAALDGLARRVAEVYLHIDIDAFAPEIAPGVADTPVPGGLSLAQAEAIVRATGERFRIRAATLATYTPGCDQDNRTLKVVLRLIELLADYARSVRLSLSER
jgi:arginase